MSGIKQINDFTPPKSIFKTDDSFLSQSALGTTERATYDVLMGGLYLHQGGYGVNAYYDGTDWRYRTTNVANAVLYDQVTGSFDYYSAPAGAAGSIIAWTEDMAIKKGGHIQIGSSLIREGIFARNTHFDGTYYRFFADGYAEKVDLAGLSGVPAMYVSTVAGVANDIIEWVKISDALYGYTQGGIEFTSPTTLPLVSEGTYDILGTEIKKSVSVTPALTDVIGGSKQTLDASVYYKMLMDIGGNVKYVLSMDEISVATWSLDITNNADVTFGNILKLYKASHGFVAGQVVNIANAGEITGTYLIQSVSVNIITLDCVATNGTYTVGDVTVGYLVQVYHGTGVLANVLPPNAYRYSPNPAHNGNYNEYTLDINGKQTTGLDAYYRILGVFATNASGNISNAYSYGAGKNKNDNVLLLDDATTYSSVATKIPIFGTLTKASGFDYIYVADSVNGHTITFLRSGTVNIDIFGWDGTASLQIAMTKNSAQLTTNVVAVTDDADGHIQYALTLTTLQNQGNYSNVVKATDVLRVHTNGAAGLQGLKLRMVFNPN